MAVLRQDNLLGQERLDLPQLRAIESGTAADFDLLAGTILAGNQPYVVSGFNLSVNPNPIGLPANNLLLNVANGVLMSPLATESGTIFTVPSGTSPQVLNGVVNSNVTGSFSASSTNIVGIDLIRIADPTTSSVASFIPANATLTSNNQEIQEIVPSARTLQFSITISNSTFGNSLNLVPIAIVVTDANNNVVSIEDARPMYFRLGSGSDSPNIYNDYGWPGGRFEYPITLSTTTGLDPFSGGDKSINSFKSWANAVTSRIQEIGGGQFWYSPISNLNMKLIYGSPSGQATNWVLGNPSTTIASASNGATLPTGTIYVASITGFPSSGTIVISDSLGAQSVTYTSTSTSGGAHFAGCSGGTGTLTTGNVVQIASTSNVLTWSGLIVAFDNNEASFSNNISTVAIVDGSATVGVGQCLYVDIDRSATTTTTPSLQIGQLNNLGQPAIPFTRFVVAWVVNVAGAAVAYARDSAFIINTPGPIATNLSYGVVELATVTTPQAPAGVIAIVPNSDSSAKVIAAGISRGNGSGSPPSMSSGTLSIGTQLEDSTVAIGNTNPGTAVVINTYAGVNITSGAGLQTALYSDTAGNITLGNQLISGAAIDLITSAGTVNINSSGAGVAIGETINIGNAGVANTTNGSTIAVNGQSVAVTATTGSTAAALTIKATDTTTNASKLALTASTAALSASGTTLTEVYMDESNIQLTGPGTYGVEIGGPGATTHLSDGNSDIGGTALSFPTSGMSASSYHATDFSGFVVLSATSVTNTPSGVKLFTFTFNHGYPNNVNVVISLIGAPTGSFLTGGFNYYVTVLSSSFSVYAFNNTSTTITGTVGISYIVVGR